MDFVRDEIMDIVYQSFQDHTCQTRCETNQNTGQKQKLTPAHSAAQPVQNDLIAPCLLQPVLLEISFKFEKAEVFFLSLDLHCREFILQIYQMYDRPSKSSKIKSITIEIISEQIHKDNVSR